MKAFTIDTDNNVTVHASAKAAPKTEGTELFTSQDALAELAAAWPSGRLIEIWNSLTGVTTIKKFKDRGTAVARIWKELQKLAAPVAPQGANVAPEETPATNDATPPADAPAAATDQKLLRVLARAFEGLTPEQREAKWDSLKTALATWKPAATRKVATPGAPREGSKISQVIAMLKREGGVTLEEIMSKMDWQKHTTRAMLSAGGSLTKQHGLTVVSEMVGDKRVYSIKA